MQTDASQSPHFTVRLLFALTAINGGRLFALTYMNLTNSELAFEQIFISSFMETTLVSITITGVSYEVISLDSSNNWAYTKNIMHDIAVRPEVHRETISLITSFDSI